MPVELPGLIPCEVHVGTEVIKGKFVDLLAIDTLSGYITKIRNRYKL